MPLGYQQGSVHKIHIVVGGLSTHHQRHSNANKNASHTKMNQNRIWIEQNTQNFTKKSV